MKIKKICLNKFRRFTELTIDLGANPAKIIALVGENGCGKSSVFDALEEKNKENRNQGSSEDHYLSKALYTGDIEKYDRKKSVVIETDNSEFTSTSIYIRSSYRFTAHLNVESIKRLPDIDIDSERPLTTSAIDKRMQQNYERLIGGFYDDVYDKEITGKNWCENNIKEINDILTDIFDIRISSLGNPVDKRGKLYFNKGDSEAFPFDNLSSGEKEAIDLLLDLKIKTKVFTDTIFCIDEPELHLNTAIQRKLLLAIEKLIPNNCQLWIATHSIGFLRGLQDDLPNESQVIDMSGNNFDSPTKLTPMNNSRKNWMKIFRTVLEDITGLVAPKRIIYCEGKMISSIDETIFNTIFSDYHDIMFISATNKSESVKYASIALTIINRAFEDVQIIVLLDRDDGRSSSKKSHVETKYLKRREFENYLFDYEIISKAFPEVTKEQFNTIIADVENDDVKPHIKSFISLCEVNDETVLKLRLAEKITPDTHIYKELSSCIFE